ncbi:PHP domain-containing protein [Termitidicoccus mucosus]
MTQQGEYMKQAGVLMLAAALLAMAPRILAHDGPHGHASAGAAEDPDISYTVHLGKQVTDIPPKREITIPNVTLPDAGELRVLKGDFHIHTLFSDGWVWPTERVYEAEENGLDVIAITDHIEYRPRLNRGNPGEPMLRKEDSENYNLSVEIAQKQAAANKKASKNKSELLIIRGTEITKKTMPPGHFNALFVQDVNKIAAVQDDYWKMFAEARAQGAFLLWNHPGWEAPKSGGIEKGAPTTFTKIHEEIYKRGYMDGIEAFNGKEFYPVVAKWCTDKNLAAFANSDIHPPESRQYGLRNPRRPVTLVFAREKTLESVKEAFFAKRTIGWAADMIFGQEKFVRPLFDACVEIKKEPGRFAFANRGSIPVVLKVGGQTVELAPLATAGAGRTDSIKTITVENWFVGKGQPLAVPVE